MTYSASRPLNMGAATGMNLKVSDTVAPNAPSATGGYSMQLHPRPLDRGARASLHQLRSRARRRIGGRRAVRGVPGARPLRAEHGPRVRPRCVAGARRMASAPPRRADAHRALPGPDGAPPLPAGGPRPQSAVAVQAQGEGAPRVTCGRGTSAGAGGDERVRRRARASGVPLPDAEVGPDGRPLHPEPARPAA